MEIRKSGFLAGFLYFLIHDKRKIGTSVNPEALRKLELELLMLDT